MQNASSSSLAEPARDLHLGIPGFSYADLFSPHALRRLYDAWLSDLSAADPDVHSRYVAYRGGEQLGPVPLSELLCAVAPHVSRFVLRLFGPEVQAAAQRIKDH